MNPNSKRPVKFKLSHFDKAAAAALTAHRLQHNRLVMAALTEQMERNPDLRFGQLLCAAGVVRGEPDATRELFNEESGVTWARVLDTLSAP